MGSKTAKTRKQNRPQQDNPSDEEIQMTASRSTKSLQVVGEVDLERYLAVKKEVRGKSYKIMIVASTPQSKFGI